MAGNIIALLIAAYVLYVLFNFARKRRPTCSCGCIAEHKEHQSDNACTEPIRASDACCRCSMFAGGMQTDTFDASDTAHGCSCCPTFALNSLNAPEEEASKRFS